MAEEVSIAVLYPELLGTYGDGGNAIVLAQRLHWRGIGAEVVEVGAGDVVPTSCDLYLMGGGEDGPQALAAKELGESGALHSAVDRGAAVFGVCAGIQVLGHEFANPDGSAHPGLGLLDCALDLWGGFPIRPHPITVVKGTGKIFHRLAPSRAGRSSCFGGQP